MRFSAALIDLDGTLVNTVPDLADATNAMRTELGLPPLAVDVVAHYVGKGADHLVMRALSTPLNQPPDTDLFQRGLALFNQHYEAVNGVKSRLYNGVVTGLKQLKAQNLKLAVVTNKPAQFVHPLLLALGLSHYFDLVVCGDTCAKKKPDPMPLLHACNLLAVKPETAVVIGDSANDALAAQAAGIVSLAVPYGYHGGRGVQNLPVDDIVADIEDAARWMLTQPPRQVSPAGTP
jgi:phosphoglycolate phosphatase